MRKVTIANTAMTDAEIDAAVTVMRSGRLRQGVKCGEFEEEFAAWTGATHALTCSSGTAALHVAYLALLEPGDEVIVPSFTFAATATMVSAAGGHPIFCDVDASTHLIDLDHAESLITERTKAIAPVHLFGNSVDVDGVRALADRHGLKVVWDAAQAHGTLWHGQDIGAFGDIVTWSFYPTKTMFVGEGGMLSTPDGELADQMRLLRSHGTQGRYNHVSLGLNYRMTDICAATGLVQLGFIDDRLAVRRRHGAKLTAALEETGVLSVQASTVGADHSYHQMCATLDTDAVGMSRDAFMAALGERGVETSVHYPRGLHQQPVFVDLYGEQRLPVTEALSESIIAFPVHHGLSDDDVDYVVHTVQTLLKEAA